MCYALHFISLNCLIVAVVVVRFGQFWRRRRRRLDFVNGWENFLILTTSTSVTTTLWNVILKLAAYESFFSLNLAADEREREKEIFCLNFYSPSLSLFLSISYAFLLSLSHFLFRSVATALSLVFVVHWKNVLAYRYLSPSLKQSTVDLHGIWLKSSYCKAEKRFTYCKAWAQYWRPHKCIFRIVISIILMSSFR